MTWFLFVTALTVSIDSFFCGFSLSFTNGKKYPIIIGISVVVFVMSLIANYGAAYLSSFLTEKTANLGGIILIAVGVFNIFKKDKGFDAKRKGIFKQSLITGFAVGLDGAMANLSLSLMGINAFYVPLTIAVMHAVAISLGILLSKFRLVAGLNKIGFLPPLVLIVLGVYKLVGFFI